MGKNRLWLNKIKVTLQNFNSLFKFDFDVLNIKTGETLQLLAIMTAALLRFLYGGTRTRLRHLRNSPSSNRCNIGYN